MMTYRCEADILVSSPIFNTKSIRQYSKNVEIIIFLKITLHYSVVDVILYLLLNIIQ